MCDYETLDLAALCNVESAELGDLPPVPAGAQAIHGIPFLVGSPEGRLLGFGDGYVEIENVKRVGGIAVGLATDEPDCMKVDEWKRQRLAGVGADFVIPNFLCHHDLIATLFPSSVAAARG